MQINIILLYSLGCLLAVAFIIGVFFFIFRHLQFNDIKKTISDMTNIIENDLPNSLVKNVADLKEQCIISYDLYNVKIQDTVLVGDINILIIYDKKMDMVSVFKNVENLDGVIRKIPLYSDKFFFKHSLIPEEREFRELLIKTLEDSKVRIKNQDIASYMVVNNEEGVVEEFRTGIIKVPNKTENRHVGAEANDNVN